MGTNQQQKPLRVEARWYHGWTVFRKYTDGTLYLDESGLRLVGPDHKNLFAFIPDQVKHVMLTAHAMQIGSRAGRKYSLILGPNFAIEAVLFMRPITYMSAFNDAESVIKSRLWTTALKARGYPPYSLTWTAGIVILAILFVLAIVIHRLIMAL